MYISREGRYECKIYRSVAIHFLEKYNELGLGVTVCSAPFSLDEERDDQELFDDLNDDAELEDSKL